MPSGMAGFFFSYWAELLSNVEAAKLLCPGRRGFVYAGYAAAIFIDARLAFLSLILVGRT